MRRNDINGHTDRQTDRHTLCTTSRVSKAYQWLHDFIRRKGKGKGAVPNAGHKRGAHLPFLGLWARRPLSLWHMASASPDLRLPSQPQSVTALWPVPSYTAWWQRHIRVRNLPRVFTPWCPAETRTRDLLTASPTPYRNTTTPPKAVRCYITTTWVTYLTGGRWTALAARCCTAPLRSSVSSPARSLCRRPRRRPSPVNRHDVTAGRQAQVTTAPHSAVTLHRPT